MSGVQKYTFGENMNSFAERKISKAMQMKGMILPVSVVSRIGHMIQIRFELQNIPFTLPKMTVPIFGPQYVRYPMMPGDKGIVIPADAYLGGVSGLGGGIADLTPPGNLSALVFIPISNTEWQGVDYSALTLYGPEGVTLRDQGSNCTFILSPTSIAIATPEKFDVTCGGTKITLSTSGWTISGDSGSLSDAGGNTSPSMMAEAWKSLITWANSHEHPNGDGGSPTGAATTQLTTEIVN